MIGLEKIKKDIKWLIESVTCLLSKGATATAWSPAHSGATGNKYLIDHVVYYEGVIYKCIRENNGAPVSDSFFWVSLGKGFLIQQEQTDWNSTGGPSFLRNHPVLGPGGYETDPIFVAWLDTDPLSSYVLTDTTITINGISYDLSENRSWTIENTWGGITGIITEQEDLINYLTDSFYPLNSNPANYLQPGDEISSLTNDAGYITASQVPAGVFLNNIPVVLSNGKTLGKYVSGQTIPAINKTFEEVLRDIALEYVTPVFTSFTVFPYSSYSNLVEVGTTLSGSKTFTWTITQNSGIVNTFSIYDIITNTNLGTNLTGVSSTLPINTRLLSTEADIQSWKAIGNNTVTGHVGTIDSLSVLVIARYKRWWGATDSIPTDRASAITLPNNDFQTSPINTFTLVTGTAKLKMVVLLPPGVIINTVYDSTNNATITSSYILSTININDANGTTRIYNMYVLILGQAYPTSANHVITTKAA